MYLFLQHLESIINNLKHTFSSSGQTKLENIVLNAGKTIDIQTIPVSDSPGREKIALAILMEDKTAKKELSDCLIESEKMASVAVGIAHEINNPLAISRN